VLKQQQEQQAPDLVVYTKRQDPVNDTKLRRGSELHATSACNFSLPVQ
jgi:hypothetical protein